MQTTSAAFTSEAKDTVRKIAHNFQVSWKKESIIGNRTFTIGFSTVGGNDVIGINPGSIGGPGIYRYFDESDYVLGLAWERGLNFPTGGLSKAMAEAVLDNTSGRFTPRHMGGSSEIFTANYQPRKPIIMSAGFNFAGIDQSIPQFAGILDRSPELDVRNRLLRLHAADYTDFFGNRYLDQEVMFTAQRTDQVLETLFGTLGMSTAQYELDTGINIIPFGLFEKGTTYRHIIHQLVEAENGHLYQDEEGKFRFENRQHWDSSPHNSVQKIITTSQVIEAHSPNDDHLVNVVEINTPIRQKQPLQTIFSLPTLTSITVPANSTVEQFFEFEDPVLELTDPTSGGANSHYKANTASDDSGTDSTSSIAIKNQGTFAKAVKYKFSNDTDEDLYITEFVLGGRVAKKTTELYYRERDDSSVTAYEERVLPIFNDYIQNEDWAASYARMILNDFSDVEKLQRLTIRALPDIQLGDLVSWQGRHWRIFDIKTTLNATVGFIQELTLLQRTITTYFRIGVSTIGGGDLIAP